MAKIAAFIYRLLGWKTVGFIPEGLKKYVILAAPHTSNWDFFYGRLYFYIFKIPVKFFIKKEWFFFPMGYLFNIMGGVPVDRSKNSKLTDEIAKSFQNNEEMIMMVTPEGTRSYNPNWKKGFYYIALKANVPIILGFLDYSKKEAGFGPVFYPSGDIEKDFEEIKAFYRTKTGKFPQKGIL